MVYRILAVILGFMFAAMISMLNETELSVTEEEIHGAVTGFLENITFADDTYYLDGDTDFYTRESASVYMMRQEHGFMEIYRLIFRKIQYCGQIVPETSKQMEKAGWCMIICVNIAVEKLCGSEGLHPSVI